MRAGASGIRPATATGDLAAIDLFGNCTFNGAPVANCRTFRDPLRSAISNSAYMQEKLRRMPSPNEFTAAPAGEPATDDQEFHAREGYG